jgi:biotin carboxylase
LLLLPTSSYKAADFLGAAERMAVEVVVGSERKQAFEDPLPGHTLTVDFAHPERSLGRIAALHAASPLDAVIGVDDEAALLAALAARELGLGHNRPEAIRASRDKFIMRERLAAAGLRGPSFRLLALDEDPERIAGQLRYPSVIKPRHLSASRGVLRVDDPASFVSCAARVARIVGEREVRRLHGPSTHLLVEDYLPGVEVALEGLVEDGRLRVLALFDKPDPLEGPTFEETLYVSPSRLPDVVQRAVAHEVGAGCRALDLTHGPIHAELRVLDGEPTLLELAARTIGGLCSRTLRFGTGIALEELVLRHALGLDTRGLARERAATGVMMLPVRRAGRLMRVRGLERARAVPGIVEVTLTLHRGSRLVPLPEGHRYLGFAFARADTAAEVERALRAASSLLEVEVA